MRYLTPPDVIPAEAEIQSFKAFWATIFIGVTLIMRLYEIP
jgi:hypothetical protein